MRYIATLLKKINWPYAVGEILLIFTGITLSLWFNDWNEEKKRRRIEIQTLQEIQHELLLDTIDIHDNIGGYQARLKSADCLLDLLAHPRKDSDTLFNWAISNLIGDSDITFHTSAYETLKSRGLETIHDDSLRLAIVRLYDFDYHRIDRMENQMVGQMGLPSDETFFSAHFAKRFRFETPAKLGNHPVDVLPKDVAALQHDTDFRTLLIWSRLSHTSVLNQYLNLRNKIVDLSQILDKKINWMKKQEG